MTAPPKRSLGLSAQKLALLSLLLEEEGEDLASPSDPIPRRLDSGPVPLSYAQQRLWFLDQLEPGTAVYNIAGGMRVKGFLDLKALEHSLNEIVRRHESLRTTFISVEGRPLQIIAPYEPFSVCVVDLRALPEAEREAQVQQLTAEEARRPFDLAVGPLLRLQLLSLASDEYTLLLSMHHIISDGWSMGVLLRELTTFYTAFAQGHPAILPELPIQYPDFAHWQQQWLQGELLQTQLDYWHQQLTGAPTVLALPTDFPRPPVQSYRGMTHYFSLPRTVTTALTLLAQQEGATLFMVLLAVFKVLLYRYTGQEDLLIGSLIANRNRAELEPLIGFFVNTLVLRTDLSGEPTFRELLRRVRTMTLGAYAHQDLPFERVMEHLKPERTLSYAPLFQVMFVLQNTPVPDPQASDGPRFTPLEFENNTAKFDLSLAMVETDQGLEAALQYNTDLFTQATIERLAGHLSTLIQSALDHPDQPIHALTLLPAPERAALLALGQGPQTDYPRDATIHQLFEAQVLRAPEAIALVFGTQQHSYGTLDHQANHLARHLQALGVTPATPVGLCVTRSPQMIIALLGILKAGAAYVPLDPQFPPERLSFMVTDAAVTLVLTVRPLQALVPETVPQVLLDEPWPRYPDAVHDSGQTGCSLAYILYTSGSTGKPKGVLTPPSCGRAPGVSDGLRGLQRPAGFSTACALGI
ncbi:condensation domain-containing protein [Anthocerotibacter panamensis]|uniref:condensation domain-containing protein n=1 Tax=Anthocerotibacter panamensis TaxID=2857077 RepID=UPI001C4067D1|nr:condensation domain-containing protein [Anthocerotibacter panamensis]